MSKLCVTLFTLVVLFGATPGWAVRPPLCLPEQATAVLTIDPGLQLFARLEESTGTRADASGKGNGLSPVNGPGRTSDHQEGSFALELTEASSQYLQRTNPNLSAGFPGKPGGANTALTVAGWVKIKSGGNHPLVIKSDGNQRSWTVWVWDFGAGPVIDPNVFDAAGRDYNGRNVADFHGSTVLQTGQWYHFAYTYDGTTGQSRVYINGVLEVGPFNERMTTYFTGTAPLRIGYRPGFGANSTYADVRLDEVVVLDRPLSDQEVDALFQYGVVPPSVFCDDGDVCDGEETCDPSIGCLAGPPPNCNDGDVCTTDTCDPVAGCVHPDDPTCLGVNFDLQHTTIVSRTAGLRDGTISAQGELSDPTGAFLTAVAAGGVSVEVTGAGVVAETFGWTANQCSIQATPSGPSLTCAQIGEAARPLHTLTLLPAVSPDVFSLDIWADRRLIRPTTTSAPVTVRLLASPVDIRDTVTQCQIVTSPRRTSICE